MTDKFRASAKEFFRRRRGRLTAGLGALIALFALFWYITESPRNQMWGKTVTSEPLSQKVVALTFDDGPNPPYTDQIVDYLHAEGVPATFFVVGMAVAAHPGSVRREAAYGDAIGDHTWDHPHLVLLTRAHIQRELTTTRDVIYQVTGVKTDLFRPPFGQRDTEVISIAHQLGFQVIMWSVPLTGDWMQPSPQTIAARVLKNVRNGSIIVLHDGNRGRPADRKNTVEATKLLVAALKKQGYHFVTVPELMHLGFAEATAAPGPTEYGPFFTPKL
jgi:peptidoglycan-N-acetylglucosamine deacetylase